LTSIVGFIDLPTAGRLCAKKKKKRISLAKTQRRKDAESGAGRSGFFVPYWEAQEGGQSKRHLEAILRPFSRFKGVVISDVFFHLHTICTKITP
jgi:hypothetical protein